MIAFRHMSTNMPLILVAGPTASGKTARAIEEALSRRGEIISVDSRQVYRTLDIGTEKIQPAQMRGVPHHLIDIREPEDSYSAGDFVMDAQRLIREIRERGNTPILAGGTHFYFDALLNGLAEAVPTNPELRTSLNARSSEELYARIKDADPARAAALDPMNRRRLIRSLEIIAARGSVPSRTGGIRDDFALEWIVIDPFKEELLPRIEKRLEDALASGLVEEVARTRERVHDARLNELGLEYRIVGEYLRGERDRASLLPALTSKLWQYARRQKAWLRKLSLSVH